MKTLTSLKLASSNVFPYPIRAWFLSFYAYLNIYRDKPDGLVWVTSRQVVWGSIPNPWWANPHTNCLPLYDTSEQRDISPTWHPGGIPLETRKKKDRQRDMLCWSIKHIISLDVKFILAVQLVGLILAIDLKVRKRESLKQSILHRATMVATGAILADEISSRRTAEIIS